MENFFFAAIKDLDEMKERSMVEMEESKKIMWIIIPFFIWKEVHITIQCTLLLTAAQNCVEYEC